MSFMRIRTFDMYRSMVCLMMFKHAVTN